MVNEPGNPNVYDLPGVPWVTYITIKGGFPWRLLACQLGHVMSNGCVNMRADDAKWLYRWSNPHVPIDKFYYEEPDGTRLDIVTGYGDSPSS